MRAALFACLLVGLPRLAAADEAPPPTEPLVEPVPIQDKTEQAPPTPENYEKPALKTPIRPREIVIEVPGIRSRQTKIVLGALLAAGAIGGGLGAYFHLESRSAANDVSQAVFNGQTWTADRQRRFEDGESAKSRAAVGYAIGGAFVIGAIVTLIVTEPKSEQAVLRPRHAGTPQGGLDSRLTGVSPIPGGAIAGAGWSF